MIILALLSRPEDLQSNMAGIKEIAKVQSAVKIILARIMRPFRSRIKSITSPHRLEFAGQISDGLAYTYTSYFLDEFRLSGIEVELMKPGLKMSEIRNFIADREIDLVVTINQSSLSKWPGKGLTQNQLLSMSEAISTR